MASPTSTRSFILPLLSALGVMSRSNERDSLLELHEFGYSRMPVDQFYKHLYHVYVYNEGLNRAEVYYVSELRVLKEPSKKLKTCHEYTIAVIKRTDGSAEVNYLAFERSIGKQPQSDDDPHPPHPDRALERHIFMEKREVPDSENEVNQEATRSRPVIVQRAMASTTSLDSIRKKAVLADDRVLVLNRPYCQKDDKLVAVLRLQPPPNAIIPSEASTSSSLFTTPRFRSRKLSDPTQQQDQSLHRTASGPSAISYVPRDPAESSTAPPIEPSPSMPTPETPKTGSKPVKRKWIYLYELAIIAYKLNKSKSLYRVFSKNCYWFAGMLIHVARMFAYIDLELREGSRISHLRPNEDILSWYDNQLGKWMNVIRVVKTPMNYTLETLVDEFWVEKLKFEEGVVRQRLQHTKEVGERERGKEEELRRAREDVDLERRKREEEKREKEEELRMVRREREEESKKQQAREEELKKVQQAREEELKKVQEERRKNEEELLRIRSEQEKDRKAREDAEQRVKLLLDYLKMGDTPSPELLAEIARTPEA